MVGVTSAARCMWAETHMLNDLGGRDVSYAMYVGRDAHAERSAVLMYSSTSPDWADVNLLALFLAFV